MSENFFQKKMYLFSQTICETRIDEIDYLCQKRKPKLWIRSRMEVTDLKRQIKFEHKPWMKDNIGKISELRTELTPQFDEILYQKWNLSL